MFFSKQPGELTEHQTRHGEPHHFILLVILNPAYSTTKIIKKKTVKLIDMNHLKLWLLTNTFFITLISETLLAQNQIPTTLDGPFKPVTRRFDPSFRRGSDDLPMNHPRLKKNLTSNFPEQISLAISSPTSMWVSWVTGIFRSNYCLLIFLKTNSCVFVMFYLV